jgi:hypothetical protein
MLHLKISIGESVHNCFAIFKCHNAQVLVQVGNKNPMANATIWLNCAPNGVMESKFALLAFKIRAFAKDLLFKVARCFHRE